MGKLLLSCLTMLLIYCNAEQQNAKRPYHLEDPMAHPKLCGMQQKELLCDPDNLLTAKQRQEILYALTNAGLNNQLFQDSCPLDPLYPRVFIVDKIVSNESTASLTEMQDFVAFLIRHQLTKIEPEKVFKNCSKNILDPVILYSFNDTRVSIGASSTFGATDDLLDQVFFGQTPKVDSIVKKALLIIVNEHRKHHNVPVLPSLFLPLGSKKILQDSWAKEHKCTVTEKRAEICDLGKFLNKDELNDLIDVYDQLIHNTTRSASDACKAAPLQPYLYLVRKVPTVSGGQASNADMIEYAKAFQKKNPFSKCGKNLLILLSTMDAKVTVLPGPNVLVNSAYLDNLADGQIQYHISRHDWSGALLHMANVITREYAYSFNHGATIANVQNITQTAAPPTVAPRASSALGDPTRSQDYEKCGNEEASRLCDADFYFDAKNRKDLGAAFADTVRKTSSGRSCPSQSFNPYVYLVNKIPSTNGLYADQSEMQRYANELLLLVTTYSGSSCGKEFALLFTTATNKYSLAVADHVNRSGLEAIVQAAIRMFIDDDNWVGGLKYIAKQVEMNKDMLYKE